MIKSQPKWRGNKSITQTSKVIKTVYQKYKKTSAREGYATPVCERAQVQGLNESRLTVNGEEDQGFVSYEEVLTI